MNIAIEFYIAKAVADYLTATVDTDILPTCPSVSFTDPMALDDAHRIVTFCPQADNRPEHPGSFSVEVQTMVKSQWTQADYATDIAAHFARVNTVRNSLLADDLGTRLAAVADATLIVIDQANKGMKFTTAMQDSWITSEVSFTVKCHLP